MPLSSCLLSLALVGLTQTGGAASTVTVPTSELYAQLSPCPPPPARGSAESSADRTAALQANFRNNPGLPLSSQVVFWNKVACELVAEHRTDPLMASRLYALLSIAQHDSLVAAKRDQLTFKRPSPYRSVPGIKNSTGVTEPYCYPSHATAVASASARVIEAYYGSESAKLQARLDEIAGFCLASGEAFPTDLAAGQTLGKLAAEKVLLKASTDGSSKVWTGRLPEGPGKWKGASRSALRPGWGEVRRWHLETAKIICPPPPVPGTKEFDSALSEVKWISDNRTPAQVEIAKRWAYGPGTPTPPGAWNEVAGELIQSSGWRGVNGELRAARLTSILNMAMMDAGIQCWHEKYQYWLIRPSQADASIQLPVGLPSFPAYTSGHSTFSGAASEVLAAAFPSERSRLSEMAEEASLSRLYGGIHYRFDCEAGLKAGREIGRIAARRL